MIAAIYLACFGLVFLGGTFLSIAWGKLSWRRWHELVSIRDLYHDRYMVLSAALTLQSLGITLIFGARLVAAMLYHPSVVIVPGVGGYVAICGLALVVSALYGFMWSIEMNRRDRWWVVFAAISLGWIIFAFWYVLWFEPSSHIPEWWHRWYDPVNDQIEQLGR